MNKIIKSLLVIVLGMFLASCKYVPAGNVAVKVNLYGSNRGVSSHVLGPGRYWKGFNTQYFIFPTYLQTYTWTKSKTEGSPVDESITFQSDQGMSVNADVGITYQFDVSKIPLIFQKYHTGVKEITHVYLRNIVRNAFVDQASKLGVEDIYGKGKTAFITAVKREVQRQVGPIGIEVDDIYLVGSLRLPAQVEAAINAKIQATQNAERARNQIAQAQAEAQKNIAIAQGKATAQLELATAKAKAISIEGAALHANPEVLQLEAIQKWDGKLPTYSGNSAVPFLNLAPKN